MEFLLYSPRYFFLNPSDFSIPQLDVSFIFFLITTRVWFVLTVSLELGHLLEHGYLPEGTHSDITLPEAINSSSLGEGTHEVIPSPCWNDEWLELVKVLCRHPQHPLVRWFHHAQKTLFHSTVSQPLALTVFLEGAQPWEWSGVM